MENSEEILSTKRLGKYLKTDMRGGTEELTYWIDREIIFLFVFKYSVSNQTEYSHCC
jgi:hypothetical protein